MLPSLILSVAHPPITITHYNKFEDVEIEDEYDSKRPWRRAPPEKQISFETESSSHGRGIEYDDNIYNHKDKAKASSMDSSSRKKITLTSSQHDNDNTSKIGTIVSTNIEDRVRHDNKSTKSFKSGSDVSELIEATAALKSHFALTITSNPPLFTYSSRRESHLSVSSLKSDNIFGTNTPIYRKPEPFRPGLVFERKFKNEKRNYSHASLVSLGSMVGHWNNERSSSSITAADDDHSGGTNKNTEPPLSRQEHEEHLIEDLVYGERRLSGVSPSSIHMGFYGERTNSGVSSSSLNSQDSQDIEGNSPNSTTPRAFRRNSSKLAATKRASTKSQLEVVDELELEDEWDVYSTSESVAKVHQAQAIDDIDDIDNIAGQTLSTFGGIDRSAERMKMVEIQQLYGSASYMGSHDEHENVYRNNSGKISNRRRKSMVAVKTSILNRKNIYLSSCKRCYFRHKGSIYLSILIALIAVLRSMLVLVLLRKVKNDETSPTPTINNLNILAPTSNPFLGPNEENEVELDFGQSANIFPTSSPTYISAKVDNSLTPSFYPSINITSSVPSAVSYLMTENSTLKNNIEEETI